MNNTLTLITNDKKLILQTYKKNNEYVLTQKDSKRKLIIKTMNYDDYIAFSKIQV